MPIPSQPVNLLPRPFAGEGTFQLIPDDKPSAGRASFKDGFPTETQLPLNMGGIAPNRTDFNGVLYMLSAFAFWQQSGGMFSYNPTLNYQTPAVVFYAGKLWWCVAPNGPDVSGAKSKIPGTDTAYWIEFLSFLAGGGGGAGAGIPVGGFLFYGGSTEPAGFFACNGQTFSATDYPKLYDVLGTRTVPDYRGLFMRGTGGAAAVQGVIRPATVGPHAHKIPGRQPSYGSGRQGLHHDSDAENDVGVERYSTTGSTLTTGSGMSTETAPVHVAQLLCIRHD